jgi:hypothetical protein
VLENQLPPFSHNERYVAFTKSLNFRESFNSSGPIKDCKSAHVSSLGPIASVVGSECPSVRERGGQYGRFLMIKPPTVTNAESSVGSATAEPRKIIIVLNWFEEVKERVPTD